MRRAREVMIDTATRLAYFPRVLISFARGKYVARIGRRVMQRYDSLRRAMESNPGARIDRRAERAALSGARSARCGVVDDTRYAVVA